MSFAEQLESAILNRKRIFESIIECDLDVLKRHCESTEWGPGLCFWCSEDGPNPIGVRWPCPEITGLARAYEVRLP